ncbi:ABC transporter substrate-binding protein, partial [Nocardia farcinica]|uniref:ABC transporter substrate-binding protein n=1 Tax=Nocardia farcinica TaxID=37329 RepID=UPI002456199A
MTFRTRTRTTIGAAALASILALTGCGGGGTEAKAPGADGATTEVSLMLNWYPYGEHAPFYYGVQEGIFAKHGIDLKISAGQGSTKTAQATGANQTDFGWADTSAVLSNIDKGVKIKSVGVFLQTTPSAVQVFADSDIRTPADLAGKTIAVSAGDAPTTTFPMYLDKAGVAAPPGTKQSHPTAGQQKATGGAPHDPNDNALARIDQHIEIVTTMRDAYLAAIGQLQAVD